MTVTFHKDRLTYEFTLDMPYGIEDKKMVREVKYKDINKLSPLPENPGAFDIVNYSKFEIYVPKCKNTIVFVFTHFPERCSGPDEEAVSGPYLKQSVKNP